MAKIVIERENGYFCRFRRIVIEVDGTRCAKVGRFDRVECAIALGTHSVQARVDWVKSVPIRLEVKDGDIVGFTCRASGGQILLHKTFRTAVQVPIKPMGSKNLGQGREYSSGAWSRPEATSSGPNQSDDSSRHRGRERSFDDQLVPWSLVLDVRTDASPEQIREAYWQRISEYHPDKVATLGREIREVAERRSKEINAAYSAAIQYCRKQ